MMPKTYMKTNIKQSKLDMPPFRPAPETAGHIMGTILISMLLPIGVATFFFGWPALTLLAIGATAALAAEIVSSKISHELSLASAFHSIIIGLLLVFMLPANCSWYMALIGAVLAVAIGKHAFGGMGRYLWHPALIGRVVLELLFHGQLAVTANSPLAGLRQLDKIRIENGVVQFGHFFLEYLPDLDRCMFGNVSGGLGETCGLALILTGLFLIYRGYLRWKLPVVFILSAYLAVAICPIFPTDPATGKQVTVYFPFFASGLASGFTYANYHLFSGGLLLSAFLVSVDMTSRPIMIKGQIIYAGCAGILTILLRLYTPIGIPCYVALLAVQTFIPLIDRITRPYGKK